jgi:hypothetical protein
VRRPELTQVVVTLLLGTGAGALAGVAWERAWTPPSGVALSHEFVLDSQGVQDDFSGTGLYVLLALATGVLLGALVGLLFRRRELLTLTVLLVAAALGGWVMAATGQALGPPDPAPLAKGLEDWAPLVPRLEVHGLSPYLALPLGAMLGLMAEFLLEVAIRVVRAPAEQPGDTLAV